MSEPGAPSITGVRLSGAGRTGLPLLVVGPDSGTTALATWADAGLGEHFDVLAWDLPGHGYNTVRVDGPVSLADLAEALLRMVDDVLAERGETVVHHAGGGVGGAVGIQLLLDAPQRLGEVVLVGDAAPAAPLPWLTPYDADALVDRVDGRVTRLPDRAALRRHLVGPDPEPATDGLERSTEALVRLALALARGEDRDAARARARAAGASDAEIAAVRALVDADPTGPDRSSDPAAD